MLTSCSKETEPRASSTYLGGQIINPVSSRVTIKKDNKLIDTVSLDRNNFFLYEFKELEPGLYEFFHNERQLVYLTEGDSLLLRLNTLEFDESLTFSGYGADRNNLLMDLFLHNEKENGIIMALYQRDPLAFEAALDSLRQSREVIWQRYRTRNETTKDFQKVAEAMLSFDNYARKEYYPISHFGQDHATLLRQLPDDFYSFREKVDFNDGDLATLYSYQRYLIAFLNHQAFLSYVDQNSAYQPNALEHNIHKLKTIDEKIVNSTLRNYLLRFTTRNFLARSNDPQESAQIYNLFMDFSTEVEDRAYMREVYETNKRLDAGQLLPEEQVVSAKDDQAQLTKLVHNKPTVFYFWSTDRLKHLKLVHLRVNELREKFPEYEYIGLNIDGEAQIWKDIIRRHGFDASKEYRFNNSDHAKEELVINTVNKSIIVDAKGKILNSHANILSQDFENELLQYLNN
ncbi:TlpA family protein disulfide reductase [Croceiramulus getboli]|nr:hypothetical protein P8624_13835 [Flavobacteriaceae bacterium YJPT1-3]